MESEEIDCFLAEEDSIVDINKIYLTPDVNPEFPGGLDSLLYFIKANQKMLNFCSESIIRGRVIVRLVISKQGSIDDASVIKSLDPIYDQEALRIVGLMPPWIPARVDTANVRAYSIVPIIFK